MSRADLSFAYAQTRLQSRFGERPLAADWQHLEATRDLGAVLQVVRAGRLARWTEHVTARPGVHELERRLREEWMRAVDEVASWQPEPWRDGTRWMRWITYLPALQKLARGGRARAWMRADPVLGPILAREPRDRGPSLAGTPLGPLAAGFGTPPDVAKAWAAHWQTLWPDGESSNLLLFAAIVSSFGLGVAIAFSPWLQRTIVRLAGPPEQPARAFALVAVVAAAGLAAMLAGSAFAASL